METNLTADEMLFEARRIQIRCALDMTHLGRAMRRACLLVLLEHVKVSSAAKRVRKPRQNVYRALIAVRPKLAEIEAYIKAGA